MRISGNQRLNSITAMLIRSVCEPQKNERFVGMKAIYLKRFDPQQRCYNLLTVQREMESCECSKEIHFLCLK